MGQVCAAKDHDKADCLLSVFSLGRDAIDELDNCDWCVLS